MSARAKRYAEKVQQQADGASGDPLYSGDHLKNLADYLKETQPYAPENSKPFAWEYALKSGTPPKLQSFTDPAEYEAHVERERQRAQCKLVFLTGLPPPQWVNTIGAEHNMHPLLLQEHLSFLPSGRAKDYALPATPSASRSIVRLAFPTVGHAEMVKGISRSDLQIARRQCAADLKNHLRLLRFSAPSNPTVVRRFHLLDSTCLTWEQEITMTLTQRDGKWTVLAWCDANSECLLPFTPLVRIEAFRGREIKLVPIVLESRRPEWNAVDPTPVANAATGPSNPTPPRSQALQTLVLVPQHYGRTLNADLASCDPFYAMSELFELVVAAETQFLNMLGGKIAEDVEHASGVENAAGLNDFQYYQDILDLHDQRLEETIRTISDRRSLPWPTSSDPELRRIAEDSCKSLLTSHEHLLGRVKMLRRQCERGTVLVLEHAHLELATRSLNHSREVGRLTELGTWIAILYVPLSFTTSIFGMNFAELGSGNKPLWIWAAISAPIAIVSVVGWLCWDYLVKFIRHH